MSIRWSGVFLLLHTAPLIAQDLPEIDYQADRHEPDAYQRYDLKRRQPWTLGFTVPVNWQSNITSAEENGIGGVEIAPELSLGRAFDLGRFSLSAELGLFVSNPWPTPELDVSGWWGALELTTGDPASGLAPYASYDPVAVHAGVFGANLLTRHALSLGARRTWGGTSFDLQAQRSFGNVTDSSRTGVTLTASQNWTLEKARLQLRGDIEQRWYDRPEDAAEDRRTVTRARIRARATIPLNPAVDLMLTADLHRHWSNDVNWRFTNFLIGPTLAARFGF